jgi:hypothetical protein
MPEKSGHRSAAPFGTGRLRRLLGLDRTAPPPRQTRKGEPLRPLTIPNLVGYARLAAIPVFLYLAFDSGDGRTASAAALYAVIAGSDYLDGLLARVTGQYSRMGALLDPTVDRLTILAAEEAGFLIALMGAGSVALWIGIPLGWLWFAAGGDPAAAARPLPPGARGDRSPRSWSWRWRWSGSTAASPGSRASAPARGHRCLASQRPRRAGLRSAHHRAPFDR